jgi:hypothetical protein
MKRIIFIGVVVAAVLALRPGEASAQAARHVILYYISSADLTVENATPLVGYIDEDGRAVDWMFDGIIMYSLHMYNFVSGGIDYPRPQDFEDYRAALFDEGQLAALATAVSNLRAELGDGDYRLKLYLTAGCVSGTDAVANTQALLDQYAALDPPELELVGFYWGYEEDTGEAAAPARIRETADFLHGLGYELVWIPYATAAGINVWASYGFDRAALQPNFAFRDIGLEQFLTTDRHIEAYGFSGVELEFGPIRNPQLVSDDPELTSALHYLDAADEYNWAATTWNVYYHGTVVTAYSADPARREIYDRLYRLISAGPRESVVSRFTVPAAADTYVEEAGDRTGFNHGDESFLNVGTNAYPNAVRTYLRFDIGALGAVQRFLSAYVDMSLGSFPYGTSIDDGRLYLVDDPAWEEMTLTGATEASAGTPVFLDNHRVSAAAAYPALYAFDVTEQMGTTLAAGGDEVSFMLRRATEDGTLAEATFDARESGAETAPSLTIVYIPATPEPDEEPDEAEPPPDETPDGPAEGADAVEPADAADDGGPDASADLAGEGDAGAGETGGGCSCALAKGA